MARARLIKPSFFTNDDLADLSMSARLLFAGLWTIADREGRLEDRPKKIKAEVLPFDSVNVDRLLTDLADAGFIARYESENLRVIQIVAFSRHQSPHPKEPASRFPAMGSPAASNGPDSDKAVSKTEPIQCARGTLADPVLPIPIAGSSEAAGSPAVALKRPPPRGRIPLTEEQRAKLFEDFDELPYLADRIEEAMAHRAVDRAKSEYLYLRAWLRKDLEQQQAKRPGVSGGANGQRRVHPEVDADYLRQLDARVARQTIADRAEEAAAEAALRARNGIA